MRPTTFLDIEIHYIVSIPSLLYKLEELRVLPKLTGTVDLLISFDSGTKVRLAGVLYVDDLSTTLLSTVKLFLTSG